MDVSPRHRVADRGGAEVAVVQRPGMRSFWKAHYEVNQGIRTVFLIRQENPWIEVLDGIVSAIPIVALFSGYMFHPAYVLSSAEGELPLLRTVKRPAFFEGRFRIDAVHSAPAETAVAVVSILMTVLLERMRG